MKAIIILFSIFLLSSFIANSQVVVLEVTKTTDPDPYIYPYNVVDSLCAPEMYGTIQWATRKANDLAVPCRIVFNIPGSGLKVINLNYQLPIINVPVEVDGTTQPGYTYPNPQILLRNNAGSSVLVGLVINGSTGSKIKGLGFMRFWYTAIQISNCTNYEITDNVIIENSNPQSKSSIAVRIANSSYGTMYGNYLGLTPDGVTYNNVGVGVLFTEMSRNNTLGGTATGQANTISNHSYTGVQVNTGTGNKIIGNKIFNNPQAVLLTNGGNLNKQAPVIISFVGNILSGTSLVNDNIDVYGSYGDNTAVKYLGSCITSGSGIWSYSLNEPFPFYVAIATDAGNNSSPLSIAKLGIFPKTKISDSQCQITNVSETDIIYAQPIEYAQKYQFNVFESGSGMNVNILKDSAQISLSDVSANILDDTYYYIAVKPQIGGIWGDWGDTCSVKTTKSISIETCRIDTLQFNYSGSFSSSDNITVEIDLPNGVSAYNNAFLTVSNCIVIADTSIVNNPVYSFTGVSGSFTLNYIVYAGCSVFDASTGEYTNVIQLSINNTPVITDSLLYHITSPWLIYDSQTSVNIDYTHNACSSENFERIISFKNTSSSAFKNGVFFFIDSIPGNNPSTKFINATCITSNVNVLSTSFVNDSLIKYYLDVTDLPAGQLLQIKETLHFIDIPDTSNNYSYFGGYYGCDSSEIMCQSIPGQLFNTYVHLNALYSPMIEYKLLNPGYDYCWVDTKERLSKIKNIGNCRTDEVYIDVLYNVSHGNFASVNNISEIDINSLRAFSDSLCTNEIVLTIDSVIIPLKKIYLRLNDALDPGEFFYLKYDNITHCPVASEYNQYFNSFVNYNWESFPVITFSELNPIEFNMPNNYPWGGTRENFSLLQTFHAPAGTLLGGDPPVWFEIDNNSLLSLGANNSLIFDLAGSRIIIEVDAGYGLEYINNSISLYSPIVNQYIYPESSTVIGPSSSGTFIRAVFAFPSNFSFVPTNHYDFEKECVTNDFNLFFNNFKVRFQLRPVCPAPAGRTPVKERVFFTTDISCDSLCLLPLSNVSDSLFITCPGCILPGWNIHKLDAYRTNFGYRDDNDNNFPDDNPLEPATQSLAKIKNIIVGDTLEYSISSHTSDGAVYLFSNIGFPFLYNQLQISCPINNDLEYIDGEFTYKSNIFGVTSSITIPYSACKRMQGRFVFDFSIDTLRTYGLNTAIERVDVLDTIIFKPRFKLIHNIINIPQPGYFNSESIDALLVMSGIPIAGLNVLPDANPLVGNFSDPAFDRTALSYWCTGFSGNIFAVGASFLASQPNTGHFSALNNSNCYNTLQGYFLTETGFNTSLLTWNSGFQNDDNVARNAFSNEIRNFWELDSLTIYFPDIFTIDRLELRSAQLTNDVNSQKTFTGNITNIPPYIVDLNHYAHIGSNYVTIYPDSFNLNIPAYTPGGYTTWDEIKRIMFTAYLKLNECPDINQPESYFSIPKTQYPVKSYWSNFPGTANGDTIVITPLDNNFTMPSAKIKTNILSLQSNNSIRRTIQLDVYDQFAPPWNYYGGDLYQPFLRANNSFIYLIPNSNINLNSVTNHLNGNPLPIVQNYNAPIYGLGNLADINYYTLDDYEANVDIDFNFDCSSGVTNDTLWFLYGWNCFNYPANPYEACFVGTSFIVVHAPTTGLNAVISATDTLVLCDTAWYTINLHSSGTGVASEIVISLPVSQSGNYSYANNSASVLFNGTTFPLNHHIENNSYVWYIDETGITGFENEDMSVSIGIMPSCGFSSQTLYFNVTGKNNCGNTILDITLDEKPNVIIGEPVPDNLEIVSNIHPFNNCTDTTTVTVNINNIGNSATVFNNALFVELPSGFVYSGGDSYTAYQNNILSFDLPVINQSGSQPVIFNISDIASQSCGSYPVNIHISGTSSYMCAGTVCPVQSNTDTTVSNIVITMPTAYISSFTSGEVVVENTSAFTLSNAIITYYCTDSLDASGNFLCVAGVDTIPVLNGFSSGSMIPGIDSVCSGCTSLTAVLNAGCICNPDTAGPVPLPINLVISIISQSDVICFGDSSGYASVQVSGGVPPYLITWSNGTTGYFADNLTAGTYIVNVIDALHNEASDTVIIGTPPPIEVLVNSTTVPCLVSCSGIASANVTNGTPPYTFEWSNGSTDNPADSLCAGINTVVVTDVNGCTATGQTTVQIVPQEITANYIIDPANIIQGTPALFTYDGIGADTVTWEIDGTTYYGATTNHTFNDYGYYCLTLTAGNICAQVDTTMTLYVFPATCTLPATFNIPDGYEVNGSEVWDNSFLPGVSEILVEGDIIIKPFSYLTIQNKTVNFSPKGRIIVERSAGLSIENSTLTSLPGNTCGMWQGIEVWGVTGSQVLSYLQGQVFITGNSTISNAHIGVLVGKRILPECGNSQQYPFDLAYSGGKIFTTNTTFNRNGMHIRFTRRNDPTPYGVINYICNNNFYCQGNLFDDKYNNANTITYPNVTNPWAGYANANTRTDVGIMFTKHKYIILTGNRFDNSEYGIFGTDNQYNVFALDTFSNHRKGIIGISTLSTVTSGYRILTNTFDYIPGNTSGSLSATDGAALYILGGVNDAVSEWNQFLNTGMVNTNSKGIIFDNTNSFEIVNNRFNSIALGTKIINSNSNGGFIRAKESTNGLYNWLGNQYEQCNTGIETDDNNENLCIRCNDYHPDATSSFNWDNIASGNIANQGFSCNPILYPNCTTRRRCGSGNRFDLNNQTIYSETSYTFYHHTDQITIPEVHGGGVFLASVQCTIPNQKLLHCPFPDLTPPIAIGNIHTDPAVTRLDSLSNAIMTLQIQYDNLFNLLDNGNTTQLLNAIYASPPSGQLKNLLLNNSPLSDTVLIALNIQNPLSPGNYKIVMQENLPVSRNVLPSFLARVETLPPGIKNQLKEKQAYNPGKITTGYLEAMIGQTILLKKYYFHELLNILLDTANIRKEDAIALYEREGSAESKMIVAATYLSDGDYITAASKIAALPETTQEISEWKTYANILLNQFSQGKEIEELDSTQIETIRTIAWQCPSNIATANARALLLYLNREEVPACPESGTRNLMAPKNTKETISYLGDNYPDPFNGNTLIPYYLPETAKGEIVIRDALGKEIIRYVLKEGENKLNVDSRNWQSGIYFYSIIIEGNASEHKKMIKAE